MLLGLQKNVSITSEAYLVLLHCYVRSSEWNHHGPFILSQELINPYCSEWHAACTECCYSSLKDRHLWRDEWMTQHECNTRLENHVFQFWKISFIHCNNLKSCRVTFISVVSFLQRPLSIITPFVDREGKFMPQGPSIIHIDRNSIYCCQNPHHISIGISVHFVWHLD